MKLATCPIVLLFLLLSAPLAVAAECTGPADPKIRVEVEEAPLRVDRSLPLVELSKIPSASRRAGMEAYDRTLGLTEADIGARADIDLLTVEDGRGGYCTIARSATIVLEWKTLVRIAAQIPVGSCIDRVVSEHEHKHVAIDRALMPIARQAIEIALTSVVRHGAYGKTLAESQHKLEEQARVAINEAVDIFIVVRTRRQLALDSKEEYNKVPASCGIFQYLRVMRGDLPKAGN
jgi:hypothetical protein